MLVGKLEVTQFPRMVVKQAPESTQRHTLAAQFHDLSAAIGARYRDKPTPL
jgi:hypothetical protein